MTKRKTDPLLAALIAKLPSTGTEWPIEQQQAWLRNMAMAFGLVYGGQVTFTPLSAGAAPGAQLATTVAAPPPKPKKPMRAFIIDKQGYVRDAKGNRVMPDEVHTEIFDERGEADLRAVTWADDSMGVNGIDVTITADRHAGSH